MVLLMALPSKAVDVAVNSWIISWCMVLGCVVGKNTSLIPANINELVFLNSTRSLGHPT